MKIYYSNQEMHNLGVQMICYRDAFITSKFDLDDQTISKILKDVERLIDLDWKMNGNIFSTYSVDFKDILSLLPNKKEEALLSLFYLVKSLAFFSHF